MFNESAFSYGDIVSDSAFVNRKAELKQLHQNFKSAQNTILISPRRWGKSSLVQKASETYKGAKTRFVFIDCFRIHSRQQFMEVFATKVLEATSSKTEERIAMVKRFFKTLIPELALSADFNNELSFKLKWQGDNLPEDLILNLPQTISKDKGLRIVVCVDEFQQIEQFDSKYQMQKTLRSYWQQHQDVCYCLYGSKRHLMIDFFNKVSMPFYRFGELIFLQKIEEAEWTPYIVSRFKAFKKEISPKHAKQIALWVQCHSYYVQQLALICFHQTKKKTTDAIIGKALRSLLEQNQIIYRRTLENLRSSHIEFLKALSDGHQSFYSKKVQKAYKFGTVGNIKRIKERLEEKEIIDRFSEQIEFVDPVFELWFRTYFLNQPLSLENLLDA